MIPNGKLSKYAVPSAFYGPDSIMPFVRSWPGNISSPGIVSDFEQGGAEIGDVDSGLLYQSWMFYVDSTVFVKSSDSVITEILNKENLQEISGSFNSEMQPVLAYVENKNVYVYWQDTNIKIDNATSPRLCLDDKRIDQSDSRDLLLFYLKRRSLCYRKEAESFLVEHVLAALPAKFVYLGRVGMAESNRVQIELLTSEDVIDEISTPGIGCSSDDWTSTDPGEAINLEYQNAGSATWGGSGCVLTEWEPSSVGTDTWDKHSCEQLGPGGPAWDVELPVNPVVPCSE